MFRIRVDRSSGNLVQCLAKNYKNDSIVSVAVPLYTVNCTHALRVGIHVRCRNTALVHVNGHDRIILVIFSQALYKAP